MRRVFRRDSSRNQRFRDYMRRRRQNSTPKGVNVNSVQEHARIHGKFDKFRQGNLFCDGLVVSSDGKPHRIHRVILAAKSDFFRAAFTSDLAMNSSVVTLDFPTPVVASIVNFCYTGACKITDENVQQLLAASDKYGIIGLIELCCHYLEDSMSISNVYGLYRFASVHGCKSLAQNAWNMMVVHFATFLQQSQEFKEMTVDDLKILLNDPYLNVPSETIPFLAISQWIEAKPKDREVYANVLWSLIRFSLISPEFYRVHVLEAPFINNISSSNLWRALNAVKNVDLSRGSWARIPHQIVFAFGGWRTGAPTTSMETYDLRADRWLKINLNNSIPRAYHGVVAVDNLIYLIGGFDGTDHFSSVRCFDPQTEIWTDKACMDRQRCYVSCVVVNKDIYAIGGFNGTNRMNSVEMYSIADNQWHFVEPMSRRRSDCGAVAVGTKIFVSGGYNGQEVLDSAELYDTNTNTWYILPNLNSRRSGVCLVLFRNYVYALGGFNGSERLKTVERLNVSQLTEWRTDVPSMITPRSNFCSVVLEDKIYVMGGFNGISTIRNCECFDGEKWYEISDMNQNRSALAACVCEGLKNAVRYTWSARLQPDNRASRGTQVRNAVDMET